MSRQDAKVLLCISYWLTGTCGNACKYTHTHTHTNIHTHVRNTEALYIDKWASLSVECHHQIVAINKTEIHLLFVPSTMMMINICMDAPPLCCLSLFAFYIELTPLLLISFSAITVDSKQDQEIQDPKAMIITLPTKLRDF